MIEKLIRPRRKVYLSKPQREAWAALEYGICQCYAWGRGSGKSKWLRLLAYLLIIKYWNTKRQSVEGEFTGIRIVFFMDTLVHFRKVHWNKLVKELSDTGPHGWAFLGATFNKTLMEISFPNGSSIQVWPATQATGDSARGPRADVILADEADQIPPWMFDGVAMPMITEPWSHGIVVIAGTPIRGMRGLLYNRFKLGQEGVPGFWSSKADYRDVPEFIKRELAEREIARLPKSIALREWLADFSAAEGLVFGEVWDSREHIRIPPDPGWLGWSEMIIGGDAGYAEPGCLLLIGIQGSGLDSVAWVLDEIYERERNEDWWYHELANRWTRAYQKLKLYHDTAAPGLIENYRKHSFVRPQPVDKSVLDGLNTVRRMLHIQVSGTGEQETRGAHLYISPKCRNLINEIGGYRNKRDPYNPEQFIDEPVGDCADHAIDSLRYALHGRFGALYRTASKRRGGHYDERV